jgi:hypothetical protein
MNDERENQIAKETKRVYILAAVIICVCLVYLKWGV